MAALVVCAMFAAKNKRAIARDVQVFLLTLLPPMLGNLIIIASNTESMALIGCYTYYIGMDVMVFFLLRFSADYCQINLFKGSPWRWTLLLLVVDVVQLLLNPVFGHAFDIAPILVDGRPYFALDPLAGQVFHRVVVYGFFFVSVGMFVYKSITAPRVFAERYVVVLLTEVFGGLWQSFYILSGTPVDQSMIGFGVFGLLVFYFSLYYRPIRLLDRMLADVVTGMPEAILFFDPDGRCIYLNDTARLIFDFGETEDLDGVPARLQERFGDAITPEGDEWERDHEIEIDGRERYLRIAGRTMTDAAGRKSGSLLTIRDRTEEEEKLLRERYYATHDRLTGLYNKEHLYDEVRRVLDENPDEVWCVCGMDVKDFKLVNDIFDKEYGDRVLCHMADNMRTFAAMGAVYGRITGDKFGFIARKDLIPFDVVSRRLADNNYTDAETNFSVVVHLGVYEVVERDLPVSVMFDRAFMAIASIKNDYQKRIAFYDEDMREDVIWNQRISTELEGAIETGQIRPYLQPMVAEDGHVEGAEVLVRWIHPEEGFLSPARFIPFFEANGRIAWLDVHMWECACKILKDWQQRGIDLFLSVNISPKDFYFIDVYQTINDLVAKYEINPAKLRLEITETVMMSDMENRLRIIEDLRTAGFMVEMDDFGSGYSSLNMLKDMPVDVLKIDMMFLYKTKDTQRAHTILQTIIDLSGKLGIPSITEGVETADQLNMLVDMGCRMFQGYYFAKPMPLEEFEEFCQAA